MDVLVPVDGSDCSDRALDFAVEFADRYDASLHVVHFSDVETEATEQIIDHAKRRVEGSDADVELLLTDRIEVRPGEGVGREIARLVEERGHDHVVMGHEPDASVVEKVIVGSTADTVVNELSVPTTVVP